MPRSYLIGGKEQGGLQTNVKPFWLTDQAYAELTNCFAWREQVRKKPGWTNLGRLRRVLDMATFTANISRGGAGTVNYDLRTNLGIATDEPNSQLEIGSTTTITIAIAAPISQTITCSSSSGTCTVSAGVITAASINFATMTLTMTFSGAGAASAATFSGAYYPSLPVLGAVTQELNAVNDDQTVFFDTTYSYYYSGGQFVEFPSDTPTTWTNPNNSNLFWSTNYYATDLKYQALWVTNNIDNLRYYD